MEDLENRTYVFSNDWYDEPMPLWVTQSTSNPAISIRYYDATYERYRPHVPLWSFPMTGEDGTIWSTPPSNQQCLYVQRNIAASELKLLIVRAILNTNRACPIVQHRLRLNPTRSTILSTRAPQ